MRIDDQIEDLQKRILALKQEKQTVMEQIRAGEKTPAEMKMESTAELEQNLAQIDEINRKVRANLDKERAEEDAKGYREAYDQLTVKINDIREARKKLLDGADLPLPGLSIEDGELIYQGQRWDNMSGSQRLIVSTAIVRKLNPECGFVLMDKLEQMDLNTLKEFGAWLEKEGLQVIATRVSTGDECSIVIEDGTGISAGYEETAETAPAAPKPMTGGWKIGGNK
jgi:soluble cytochrome b562